MDSPLARTLSEGQRDKCHSECVLQHFKYTHKVDNSMSVPFVPAVRSLEALLALLCIPTQCQDILDY